MCIRLYLSITVRKIGFVILIIVLTWHRFIGKNHLHIITIILTDKLHRVLQ